jgi:hypothetical protein
MISFIKKLKLDFIPVEVKNINNKKDIRFPKNWNNLISYEYGKKELEANPSLNNFMIKVPKNLIIFDIDSEENYYDFVKILKEYDLYDKSNITKSYSNIHFNQKHKKHFYFYVKKEDRKELKKLIPVGKLINTRYGIDIFYDTQSKGAILESGESILSREMNSIDLDIIKMIMDKFDFKKQKQDTPKIQIKNVVEKTKQQKEPHKEESDDEEEEPEDEKIKIENMNQSDLIDILNNLSFDRVHDYNEWIKILLIFKNEGLPYSIFNEWSKKSALYDKKKNLKQFKKAKDNDGEKLTIRSLFYFLKEDNKDFFDKITDKLNFLQVDLNDFNTTDKQHKIINCKYLYDGNNDNENQFTYNDFKNNDTIIIKSNTGTGKTSTISKFIKQEQDENKDTNFISIVSLRSLADQQCNNFSQLKNLVDYRFTKDDLTIEQNLLICINSLKRLKGLSLEKIKKTTVYIDEINSFLQNLTNNDLFGSNTKEIFYILKRLINNCKKLIVSDATTLNNLNTFIKNRNLKTLFLQNDYISDKKIKVHHVNEDLFMQKILDDVSENKYFLFCSDSATTIKRYTEFIKNIHPHKLNDIITIHRNSNFKIEDATKQFKNKFVFYSPSILYGVDFNNEEAQRVYIHTKGLTINPLSMYQQINRTRNITEVYLYSKNERSIYIENNSIEKIETNFNEIIKNYENIKEMFEKIDENDQKIIDPELNKSFYSLFLQNNLLEQRFNSNKTRHLKNILSNYGFEIIDERKGFSSCLSKETNRKMNKLCIKAEEEILRNIKIEDIEESDEHIKQRIEFLGLNRNLLNNFDDEGRYEKELTYEEQIKLQDDEKEHMKNEFKSRLNKYKNIIFNESLFRDHLNISYYEMENEYKKNKFKLNDNFEVKSINSNEYKQFLITEIEEKYNINIRTNEILNNNNKKIDFDEKLFSSIKDIFKNRKKPEIMMDVVTLYNDLIKSCISKNLIRKNQLRTKENRGKILYSLNEEFYEYHKQLRKLRHAS